MNYRTILTFTVKFIAWIENRHLLLDPFTEIKKVKKFLYISIVFIYNRNYIF